MERKSRRKKIQNNNVITYNDIINYETYDGNEHNILDYYVVTKFPKYPHNRTTMIHNNQGEKDYYYIENYIDGYKERSDTSAEFLAFLEKLQNEDTIFSNNKIRKVNINNKDITELQSFIRRYSNYINENIYIFIILLLNNEGYNNIQEIINNNNINIPEIINNYNLEGNINNIFKILKSQENDKNNLNYIIHLCNIIIDNNLVTEPLFHKIKNLRKYIYLKYKDIDKSFKYNNRTYNILNNNNEYLEKSNTFHHNREIKNLERNELFSYITNQVIQDTINLQKKYSLQLMGGLI